MRTAQDFIVDDLGLLKLTSDSALNVGCPPAYPPERTAGVPSPRSDSKRWPKYLLVLLVVLAL